MVSSARIGGSDSEERNSEGVNISFIEGEYILFASGCVRLSEPASRRRMRVTGEHQEGNRSKTGMRGAASPNCQTDTRFPLRLSVSGSCFVFRIELSRSLDRPRGLLYESGTVR